MERLTEKVYGYTQLKACGNDFCKETCAKHDDEKSCDNCPIQKAIEKLAKYEDLEEQCLLPKLPCKVGDIIYFTDESIEYIFPITIAQIIISDLGEGEYCVQYNGCFFNGYGDAERDFEFETDDFGKTVFLAHPEAEEALRRMKREE